MKNIFIKNITPVLSVVLILSVASCSKDQSESGVNGVSSEKIRITGSDANTTTKTTLNGLVTSWVQTTDKVGIYSTQARTETGGSGSEIVNAQFTAASSAFSSSFTGAMYWGAENSSHTFYAYYPYATGSPAATAIPLSLPAAQTQSSANSNAHIGALDFMVATPVTVTSPANTVAIANEVNLKYNHLFTVLEFQINGTGQLKAVKLSANSTLAFSGGTIDITQSTPATDAAYTFASQTGTSAEVTTTLTTAASLTANNTETKVYMVINPGIPTGNCLIGLSDGTTWKCINKAAPAGGFKRGVKYVVTIDAATATDAVVDIDGNIYTTVTIGTQVWMASNLKTTKYNDGTTIPNVKDNGTWGSATTGAWCDYGDNSSNSTTYGKLYNWYAVDNNEATKVASNGGKNICPAGWHVPTDADWTTLTDYLGGFSVAGDKLKETGTSHWISNTAATNSSGFTALPGGYRKYDGWGFESLGTEGRWWSTSLDLDDATLLYMSSYGSSVGMFFCDRKFGFSVRCIKD